MTDVIDYKLYGDDMQIVEVELDPNEGIQAEVGAMIYMDQGIEMNTSTGGGLMQGFKRIISGESFFITTFYNSGSGKKRIGFGAPYPGKIIPLDLGQLGGTFICQKDAFLCAANGTDISIQFSKKLGAGFFGGEGFILQKLTGDGLAFIHAGGTIIKKELAYGEMISIDTGCLVAMSPQVDFDIKFVGGVKNALFGGEGLFLATLKGPGIVYLQSLPFSRMADRIASASRFNSNKGETKGAVGSILNMLGN